MINMPIQTSSVSHKMRTKSNAGIGIAELPKAGFRRGRVAKEKM